MLSNRWTLWVPAALIMMQGCARPDISHFQKHPTPMVVHFEVPSGVSSELKDEYAAAMRARLATCTTVVAEGVQPPVGASTLRVIIQDRDTSQGASPGAVGAATGIAVGALSMLAGNRDAAFDGVFWGIWAGTQAAEARREQLRRMGFQPPKLHVRVELSDGLQNVLTFHLSPDEILDGMMYLPEGQRQDEFRQMEAEAKALARVVVSRIQEEMGWMVLPEPSWYEGAKVAPLKIPMAP